MDDFTAQIIYADDGNWTETEIENNNAIVKVRASSATLAEIEQTEGFELLPDQELNDPISDLSNGEVQSLRGKLIAAGHSPAKVTARFGASGFPGATFGDILEFLATRRFKPRYEIIDGKHVIFLDGPVQACRSIGSVDKAVQGG